METSVVTTPFGRFRCFNDQFGDDLRRYGAHQRSDLAIMRDLVSPGDWAIDVGAFIGTVTVPIASAVGPTGRVLCFEPVAEHYALLVENVEANDVAPQVTAVHALVGGVSGQGHFTSAAWEMSSATTAFRPAGQADADDDELLASWRLDDWIADNFPERQPIRLLKVDVEGMELAVLEGAAKLIDRDRPCIELEVGGGREGAIDKTAAFLRAHNYRVLLNVAERDSTRDDYQLGPLSRLTLLGDMLSDVLAVPAERPSPLPVTASRWKVQWVVLSGRLRLQSRWRRVRSRLRRRP